MYHFDALWPSFVHWKSVIQLFRFLRATLNRPGGLYKPLREKSIRENHSFSVPRTLVPSFNQMRLFHARVIVSYRSSPDPPSLLLFFLDYTSHENEKICKKKKISRTFLPIFQSSKSMEKWKRCRITKARIDRAGVCKFDPFRVHFTAYSLSSFPEFLFTVEVR